MKNKFFSKTGFIVFAILFIGIGFIIGHKTKNNSDGQNDSKNSNNLRLSGYKFVKPLLICDNNPESEPTKLYSFENNLTNQINEAISNNKISAVSVYYRDFTSGDQININSDEKFFPASLNKVPFMIALLKASEADPGLLQKTIDIDLESNTNAGEEIQPMVVAESGKTYTVEELMQMMIKYSDNNSLYKLTEKLDKKYFDNIYKDFNNPYPQNQNEEPNFLTAYQFAYFLRTLYSATYLNPKLSEKALELMSKAEYKNALVAGVPDGITVAHKFGLSTIYDSNKNIMGRQLHDCGIIYGPKKTYLLCVMTESKASLSDNEEVIKNISKIVYSESNK